MLSFKAHDLHVKKMIDAILLFKFFPSLDRESSNFQNFQHFGGNFSLKIKQFQD
jgi:hypothetical protein